MSRYWTYAEMKQKVEDECDLEREIFVSDDELMAYFNEGIDLCEAKIHSLYEDYFLSREALTLVSGTDEYVMPTTIYGHKIRSIIYKNGSTVYPIHRCKNSKKLFTYEVNLEAGNNGAQYEYFILNTTAGSPKILFIPPVLESGERVYVWFLRNANRLTASASVCDIPEFVHYVIQYAKVKIYFKEGHPGYAEEKATLDTMESEMLGTLANMVPDEMNEIEADLSSYQEMS